MKIIHIFDPLTNFEKQSGVIIGATILYLKDQATNEIFGSISYCSSIEPSYSRKKGTLKASDWLLSNENDFAGLPRRFRIPNYENESSNREKILYWLASELEEYAQKTLFKGFPYPDVLTLLEIIHEFGFTAGSN